MRNRKDDEQPEKLQSGKRTSFAPATRRPPRRDPARDRRERHGEARTPATAPTPAPVRRKAASAPSCSTSGTRLASERSEPGAKRLSEANPAAARQRDAELAFVSPNWWRLSEILGSGRLPWL